MLLDQIKTRLTSAIKENNEAEKSILRVVLGEAGTAQGRTGTPPTDTDVKRIVKKLIQSNEETLTLLPPDRRGKLLTENEVLTRLVPKSLSKEEVKERLLPVSEEIRESKSEGQAVGLSMKHLKGLEVDGNTVKSVVQEIRK